MDAVSSSSLILDSGLDPKCKGTGVGCSISPELCPPSSVSRNAVGGRNLAIGTNDSR